MAKAEKSTEEAPKKKGKMMLIVLVLVGLIVLGGGGAAAAIFLMKGGSAAAGGESFDKPRLVPKAEEKRGGSGKGEGEKAASTSHAPMGAGGDKYASTYYTMDKEFTSNLKDSVHFIQVGIAVSTPYDDRVIEALKTHEIAVRSAILLALGDATEEQVFAVEGKRKLQVHLTHAINDVLKQKEGFGGIGNVYFTTFVVQ